MASLLSYLRNKWLFNEGTGTTVADSVGSCDGTLTYGGTWEPGGGVRFDGETGSTSASHVYTSCVSNPGVSAETLWLYYLEFSCDSANGAPLIVLEAREYAPITSWDNDRNIYVGTDGKLRFGIAYDQAYTVASSVSVADGKRHKVAAQVCTRSPPIMKMWLDGAYVGTITASNASTVAGHLCIGGRDITNYGSITWPYGANAYKSLDGVIYEARYYATLTADCLTEQEGNDLTYIPPEISNAIMFSCNT